MAQIVGKLKKGREGDTDERKRVAIHGEKNLS
jgi:hypothetical protein